jgi:hypothetical protein
MFNECTDCNQPLNEWDVTDMNGMFNECTYFNQNFNERNTHHSYIPFSIRSLKEINP